MEMIDDTLKKLGFCNGKDSTHFARTMMFSDISKLLHYCGDSATYDTYCAAVIQENILSKPSQKSRTLAWQHLSKLYSLSDTNCLFRIFRNFSLLDAEAQPLLAFQLALARDPVLWQCTHYLTQLKIGEQITRENTENYLNNLYPDRFTKASLKSFAQNINGTWTQAGFLKGKAKKTRVQPVTKMVNIAYALFMAYLEGYQAKMMLSSQWIRIIGIPEEEILQMASQAAHKGLLVFRRTGDVMEFEFPNYLTKQEQELLNESY